jgi:hypothetical protein
MKAIEINTGRKSLSRKEIEILAVMESPKYIQLLLLVPEVLSGNISKEQLLDEMVKLGLTEEKKNELLKQIKEE